MSTKQYIPTLVPSELDRVHDDITHKNVLGTNYNYQAYHINNLDIIADKSTFQVLPHRKTVHDFLILKKGTSKRSKGLDMYDFGPSSVFILPAYQITQHEMISNDAEGYYCYFDEKIFDFLPKNYLNEHYTFFQLQSNPVIQLSEESLNNIELILKRISDLYSSEKTDNNKLVAFNLLVLFEELDKQLPLQSKKIKNSYLDITERYKAKLSQHIYTLQNISDYANLLHITPDYLNKCVKNATNKTAQHLLKEMIILEAKTLLKYSNLHISEIAIKLCDQNPSNFARFFKTQTGLTPMEYLNKY